MIVWRFVLLGVLFMPVQTQAQSYFCSRPSEPNIPGGYYAERYQMESAQSEVEDYIDEMQEYLDCLRMEMNDARSEAESVQDEWRSSVSAYNNR
jgi:hypothetical protein